MAELKTKPSDGDVDAFLDAVPDERRRHDAKAVCALMSDVSGEEPRMWGTAMVGFGRYSYTYASGRSGEWFAVGFSPRKASLVVYLMDGYEQRSGMLSRLGKHSVGKACLYVKRLTTSTPRCSVSWSRHPSRRSAANNQWHPAPRCPSVVSSCRTRCAATWRATRRSLAMED